MLRTTNKLLLHLLLVFLTAACTAPVPPTETPTSVPAATEPVTLDPAHTESHLLSDRIWLLSASAAEGWKNSGFDDSTWSRPALVENAYPIPGSLATGLWESPYVYKLYRTLYFRKAFDVQVLPARARLVVVADDSVNVYLNGNMVYTDSFKNASYIELDVTQWLRQGKNVVALQGKDVGQGTAYLAADLGLCPADAPDRYPPFIYSCITRWGREASRSGPKRWTLPAMRV